MTGKSLNTSSNQFDSQPGRSYRFLVPAGLVIAGGVLLFAGVDRGTIQSWLENAGSWAPVVFVLTSIALMSMLLPKTAVSLAAGALFGTILGSLLMLLIAVSSAILNYCIGRWWLHDSILCRLSDQAELGKVAWARAIRTTAAEAGFGFHLLVRLAPIPTMLISYSMGAAGARIVPFVAAAAVAVIPQVLWVHGGSAVSMDDSAKSDWHLISALVAVLAGVLIALIVPREAMRRIRADRDR